MRKHYTTYKKKTIKGLECVKARLHSSDAFFVCCIGPLKQHYGTSPFVLLSLPGQKKH